MNSENTHHTYHHTLTRAWSRLRSTLYSPLPQTCALVMTHVSAVKSRLKEHDPRVEGSLEALIAPSHPPMSAWVSWISTHLDRHGPPPLVAGGQAARAGSLQTHTCSWAEGAFQVEAQARTLNLTQTLTLTLTLTLSTFSSPAGEAGTTEASVGAG